MELSETKVLNQKVFENEEFSGVSEIYDDFSNKRREIYKKDLEKQHCSKNAICQRWK